MTDEAETTAPTGESPQRKSRDFFVVAVLLALVAVAAAAFAAGWALGRNGDDEPDTFAHELEAWAECLAVEGAMVPAVGARDDGSFTLEFSAGFFDEFGIEDFVLAADECRGVLPLEEVVAMLGVGEVMVQPERFLDRDLLEEWPGLFGERGWERGWERHDLDDEPRGLVDLLERLRENDRDLARLFDEVPPEQLERLCAALARDELPIENEDALRLLTRVCRIER